ncbi:MAG: F0F1 ATP synthase subunit alpha [Candidatus Dormiibacterota bacterium]
MDNGQISEVIRERLRDFDAQTVTADVGRVISVGDGIAQIYGLQGAMASELLEFPGNVFGMALNLEVDRVRAVVMGPYEHIQEGDEVRTTGRIVEVPVGPELLGRVVDALGQPIDGKGPINAKQVSAVEKIAPGVITRTTVDTPIQTGILAIDGMIPIGRGQRELIIGDRQTGKTAILLDTIVNQKGKGVYCIYCAIGQNAANIARVREALEENGALDYTVIVAATASEPAPLNYIAPYTACAIGEYFRDNGEDALVCYDDLTKHAWAYREMSLNLRRPPGREAYPGDVFYLHSRLLERAARMSPEYGNGSLTALPVIETQANDVSAYIPTNVISITDGQIYLEGDLFNAGQRPAISVGLSVSRVGGDAQIRPINKTSGQVKSDLAQFRELAAFSQFASDLDAGTRRQLDRGRRLTELLRQQQYEPIHAGAEVAIFYGGTRGLIDQVPVERVGEWKAGLIRFLHAEHQDYLDSIEQDKKWDDEVEARTRSLLEEYNQQSGFVPDAGSAGKSAERPAAAPAPAS